MLGLLQISTSIEADTPPANANSCSGTSTDHTFEDHARTALAPGLHRRAHSTTCVEKGEFHFFSQASTEVNLSTRVDLAM
jgi:hypothetical protein